MERELDVGGTSKSLEAEDLETRVRQLEEDMAALRGDSRLANLPYGTLRSADSSLSLRSVGGSLGGRYPAGVLGQSIALEDAAMAINLLLGIPFWMPSVPNVVVEIGIRVNSAAAGNVRLGVYADRGEGQLYPGKLLLDAGVVSTSTTGTKAITVRQEFPRGLKWIAALGNSATAQIRRIPYAGPQWALLGYSGAGSRYSCYGVSKAYGALPDPFPSGATERAMAIPYIFLKFG